MLSLNVRGMRTKKKRECLFNWLSNQKAEILFLQETYSTQSIEAQWRRDFEGDFFFAHGSNHSKGVLVILKPGLDIQTKSVECDSMGRYVIIEAVIQDTLFLLVNLYAPTRPHEQSKFFKLIAEKLQEFEKQESHQIVVGGDVNIYFDKKWDCDGSSAVVKSSVKDFNSILEENDLVDIWRLRNPDTKRFTWRQRNPLIQRRLDYWFISDDLQDDIEYVDIKTAVRSDHSAIILGVNSIKDEVLEIKQ